MGARLSAIKYSGRSECLLAAPFYEKPIQVGWRRMIDLRVMCAVRALAISFPQFDAPCAGVLGKFRHKDKAGCGEPTVINITGQDLGKTGLERHASASIALQNGAIVPHTGDEYRRPDCLRRLVQFQKAGLLRSSRITVGHDVLPAGDGRESKHGRHRYHANSGPRGERKPPLPGLGCCACTRHLPSGRVQGMQRPLEGCRSAQRRPRDRRSPRGQNSSPGRGGAKSRRGPGRCSGAT